MNWEILLVLAFLLLAPAAVGYLVLLFARRYFPSGSIARSPKLTYFVVVVAWLSLLAELVLQRTMISTSSSPPMSPSPQSPPQSQGPPSVRNWWFPWPPPAPSAATTIPIPRLLAGATVRASRLGDVDESLRSALGTAGHFEASYYGVPRGFALVTRLESIQSNGMPKPGSLRWDIETRTNRPFSLSSYLEALFTAPPGRYRVIVFVVTPERFATVDTPVDRDQTSRWLREGANALPQELMSQPVDPSTICTALIYEFWKESDVSRSRLLRPGAISADRHVVGTGLERLLR